MQVPQGSRVPLRPSSGISNNPSGLSQKRPTRKIVSLSPIAMVLKDTKDKDYISIKDAEGNIIEIKSKPKEYRKSMLVENRKLKNETKGEYSDHVIKFDKKGNILKEIFKDPYQSYMQDNRSSKQFRSEYGIMNSKVIDYKDNNPIFVQEYDKRTTDGRSDKNYTRLAFSPYLKSSHDYGGDTSVIYDAPRARISGQQGNVGMAIKNASSTVIKEIKGPDNEITEMIDNTKQIEQSKTQEKNRRLQAFYSNNPSFKKKKDEEEEKKTMLYGKK